MEDISVLVTITLAIIGFGMVPLLGALLPRDDRDDERDEEQH